MVQRLGIGRPCERLLARGLPVGDRLLCEAGLLRVVGQHLGERAVGLQPCQDRLMNLPPAAAQKALVGGVADQRMLEGIGCLGVKAVPENQLGEPGRRATG